MFALVHKVRHDDHVYRIPTNCKQGSGREFLQSSRLLTRESVVLNLNTSLGPGLLASTPETRELQVSVKGASICSAIKAKFISIFRSYPTLALLFEPAI